MKCSNELSAHFTLDVALQSVLDVAAHFTLDVAAHLV